MTAAGGSLLKRRLHYLHQTVADPGHYWVLAGVDDLLPRLLADGYLLGLVAGNLEAAAHIKLRRSRLNRFFSVGGYGSDSTDRGKLTRIALRRGALVYGEELDLGRCVVVGDTPYDADAAHAAGLACAAVASHNFKRWASVRQRHFAACRSAPSEGR